MPRILVTVLLLVVASAAPALARQTSLTERNAELVAPAPGTTLPGSNVTFEWNGGLGVSRFWIYVGTTPGARNILDADRGTSLSAIAANVPTNGSDVYVRLWSLVGTEWRYTDARYYTRATAVNPASLVEPAPLSTLRWSTETFTWTPGTGASEYWLTVGTTMGGQQIYHRSAGRSLAAVVPNIPLSGGTLYVRLWSLIGASWSSRDYTVTAPSGASWKADLRSPGSGSTLQHTTVKFRWDGGRSVSQFWISVGSTAGGTQYFDADRGTDLSAVVTGLPRNGSPVFVRLWSRIGAAWEFNDYSFAAADPLSAAPQAAELIHPANGTILTGSQEHFEWTAGRSALEYWLSFGSAPGLGDFGNFGPSTSMGPRSYNIPAVSRLYVRLWTRIPASGSQPVYLVKDYSYPVVSGLQTAAELISPAPSSQLTSSNVTFRWRRPSTLSSLSLEVGYTPGGRELFHTPLTGVEQLVSNIPTDGRTIFVRLWTSGSSSATYSDYQFTAPTGATELAELVSPPSGSTVTSSAVRLEWTGGAGASQYWIYVGTRGPGDDNLMSQDRALNLHAVISGLPVNQSQPRTLYIRLWSKIGSVWLYKDYTLKFAV